MLNLKVSFFVDKKESPNLFALFKVKALILALNLPFLPLENAFTWVVAESYPKPVFKTIACITLPFSIIGLTIAPLPCPVDITRTSGGELYSLPLLTTATLSILPLTIIGLNSAFFPFWIVTLGVTSLSRI